MLYLLDGYNLLFALIDSQHPLAAQRQQIIRFLQKLFAHYKMDGLLVFDGRVRRGEESGRSYASPLEVIYTPEGQSADEYIIERIGSSKGASQMTVVTNDRGLIAHARSFRVQTMNVAPFIQWLTNRKKTTHAKPTIVETKHNLERLLKIFEKRFEEGEG